MASAIQKLFAKRKAKQAAKRQGASVASGGGGGENDDNDGGEDRGGGTDIVDRDGTNPPLRSSPSSALAPPTPAPHRVPFPQTKPSRSSLDASVLLRGGNSAAADTTGWLGRKGRFNSAASAPMLESFGASGGVGGSVGGVDAGDVDAFSGDTSGENPTDSIIYRRAVTLPSLSLSDDASLVVVPTNEALLRLPDASRLMADDHWLALHVYAPSRLFKDRWESVRLDGGGDGNDGIDNGHDHGHNVSKSTSPLLSAPPSSSSPPSSSFSWRGTTATLTIDDVNGTVTIQAASLPKKTLSILSDTSVYKSLGPTATSTTTAAAAARHDLSFHVISRPSKQSRLGSRRKIRLVVVQGLPFGGGNDGGGDVNGAPTDAQDHAAMPPPAVPDTTAAPLCMPPRRSFFADLLFVVAPHSPLSPSAFATLAAHCRSFDATYLFVPMYEEQNVRKLRDGVLMPAMKKVDVSDGAFASAGKIEHPSFAAATAVLENVMMGYLHARIYPAVASQPHLRAADERWARVITAYHSRTDLFSALGIRQSGLTTAPHRLDKAVRTLALLSSEDGCDDAALVATILDDPVALRDQLQRLATARSDCERTVDDGDDDDDVVTAGESLQVSTSASPRTPLDIAQILTDTVQRVQDAHASSARPRPRRKSTLDATNFLDASTSAPAVAAAPPLSTDELLPLLAYVAVRARVVRLPSLLDYARVYGRIRSGGGGGSGGEDYDCPYLRESSSSSPPPPSPPSDATAWALVTFKAVCEWLSGDPARVLEEKEQREENVTIRVNDDAPCNTDDDHADADAEATITNRNRLRHRRRSLPASTLLRPPAAPPTARSLSRAGSSNATVVERDASASTSASASASPAERSASPVSICSTRSSLSSSDGGRGGDLSTAATAAAMGAENNYLSFGALDSVRGADSTPGMSSLHPPHSLAMTRQSSHASSTRSHSSSRSSTATASTTTNDLTIRRQIQIPLALTTRSNSARSQSSLGEYTYGRRGSTSASASASAHASPRPESPTVRVVGPSSPSDVGSGGGVKMGRAASHSGPRPRGAAGGDVGAMQSSSSSLMPRRGSSGAAGSRGLASNAEFRGAVGSREPANSNISSPGSSPTSSPSSSSLSWRAAWFAPSPATSATTSPTSSSLIIRTPSGSGFSTAAVSDGCPEGARTSAKPHQRRRGSIGLGLALLKVASEDQQHRQQQEEEEDCCSTPTVSSSGSSVYSHSRPSTAATARSRRSRLLSGSNATLHASVAAPVVALQPVHGEGGGVRASAGGREA